MREMVEAGLARIEKTHAGFAAERETILVKAREDARAATALAPEAQEAVGEQAAAVFSRPPRISFRADTALIAGAALRGPRFILRTSWRAQLDRIAGKLRDAA